MTATQGAPRRPLPFLRDPILWAGGAVWLLSLLPSLADVLPSDLAFSWADQYSDVPMLGFVVVAAAMRARAALDRKERTFWRLFIAGNMSWIAVRGLYVGVPYAQRGMKSDLFTDVSYLLGYLCLIAALELRPDRVPPGRTRAGKVESLGVQTFAFLMLSYFTLAPSVFNPEAYASWVTSMALYAVLDAWLLAHAVRLLRAGLAPGWVVPVRWLAGAFAVWLVGDVMEGLMYMKAIPYIDAGSPVDVVWAAPQLLLLLAVRSRVWWASPGPAARPVTAM